MKPLIALLDGSTDDYSPIEKFGFDRYLENRSATPHGRNRKSSSPLIPGTNANIFSKAVT